MKKEAKKNEGPTCACGKGDLYEEWRKNENNKKLVSDTATSEQTEDGSDYADSAGKEN